jgi:centromere protein I
MSKPGPSTDTSATATTSPASPVETYPKDYVNLFNGFLMDICNCLWRSRAFNTSDTNALGCLLPPSLLPLLNTYVAKLDTGLALPSLFSLSYSPVLCSLSIAYIRELEDAAAEAEGEGRAAGETRVGVADGNVTVATVKDGEEVTMQEIQIRHAGPVTQRSLVQLGKEGGLKLSWPNYRLGVLRYLEGRGVLGVGELMYNTLKHLMSARDGAAKA